MSKNRKILIISITASVLLNALIVILNIKQASLTLYSIPSFVLIIFSVIYGMIAYSMREDCNMLLYPQNRLYLLVAHSFRKNEYHTSSPNYEKEFGIIFLIYCVFIPFYIPFAFLSSGFYTGVLRPLFLTLIEELIITLYFVIYRWVSIAKGKKNQNIIDAQARKEQEKRESMGQWK